jgi:hypothetical protein
MINQLPIYTIGDSHAKFTFSINDSVHPRIKSIFWIGPITMHRVGRDTIKFTDHHVPKDGFVISCFGEIDTRCHIKRQCDMQRDEDEIIQTIVTNYINTLQLNRSDGYTHIAIMNIVPTLEYQFAKDDPLKTPLPTFGSGDLLQPYEGTVDERKRYIKKINKVLEKEAKINGFYYLNIYDYYKNENDFLPIDMTDGGCHLESFKYIDTALDDMFNSLN